MDLAPLTYEFFQRVAERHFAAYDVERGQFLTPGEAALIVVLAEPEWEFVISALGQPAEYYRYLGRVIPELERRLPKTVVCARVDGFYIRFNVGYLQKIYANQIK